MVERQREKKREREKERQHSILWSLISALSVWYKFLQGGDKYTAVPALPPHPSFFLSPVLLHILALSCAKQMESIDMLMRQGLLHSSPGATTPHVHVYIQWLGYRRALLRGSPPTAHTQTYTHTKTHDYLTTYPHKNKQAYASLKKKCISLLNKLRYNSLCWWAWTPLKRVSLWGVRYILVCVITATCKFYSVCRMTVISMKLI